MRTNIDWVSVTVTGMLHVISVLTMPLPCNWHHHFTGEENETCRGIEHQAAWIIKIKADPKLDLSLTT